MGLLVDGLLGYWPPLREDVGFGEGSRRGLTKAVASTTILWSALLLFSFCLFSASLLASTSLISEYLVSNLSNL